MSIAGRKPKPIALKLIEGNPGKRPLNTNEPKPPPEKPACPRWLLPEAKKEWARVTPILHKLGLATKIDRTALAGYCQAYARWREAEEFVTKHGSVLPVKDENGNLKYLQQVPQVGIAHKNLLIVKALCAEFGLTPSARSRISLPGREEDDDLLS